MEYSGKSCATAVEANHLDWDWRGLTVADCAALADVIATNGLPRLETLYLHYNR